MQRLNFVLLKVAVLSVPVLAASLLAQTGPTVTAPALTSFTIESVVPFDYIDTANTTSLTQGVIDSIKGGALEVRQQIRYDAASKRT